MRTLRRRRAALAATFAFPAAAEFPDKPIRLIVPQAPGSATDTVARILGAELAQGARPADRGRQPAGRGAHHRPRSDGESPSPTATPSAWGRSARSRSRATWWRSCPTTSSATSSRSRWWRAGTCCWRWRRTRRSRPSPELIDYAKKNPGKLSNASSSNGSPGHVGGELFKYMSGTEIVHIPYRGGAAAINDLIAGRVQLMFESLNSIAPHARSGTVRALARHRRAALARLPRPADGRRGRRAGLCGADLERRDRPGRHPAADRRQAQRRDQPRDQFAGLQGALRRDRRRAGRRHARRNSPR